jgi:uracil-DNA glycosylase family 4
MSRSQQVAETIEEIQEALRYIQRSGIRRVHCSEAIRRRVTAWGSRLPAAAETLDDVRQSLGDCRRCRLAEKRTHIVFGEGTPRARLVFVGEGPGFEEDQQGRPFVGAAGQLLTKIIQAIGLSREQVYICNVIKCRPPGNRNPEPDEIETCNPFLERQLKAIRPEFICALGKFAAQTLAGSAEPISRLRGRFFDYKGIKVLPTYHPAYLLRNPEKKRAVWEDMQVLMKAMGLPLPETGK